MISNPDLIIKSPGRINLIGEHVDYNGGHVLPAAINRKITFHFKKINSPICSVHSINEGKFSIDLRQSINISEIQWENYILGVLDGLIKVANIVLKALNVRFQVISRKERELALLLPWNVALLRDSILFLILS